MNIPVYLMTGLLDAGKTTFINGILEDGFARQDPTLLLCCEEGEEEYDADVLQNVTKVTVEDFEELTPAFFRDLERKYRPAQVLMEYNGMWPLVPLFEEKLPVNWQLFQILTFVDARSFELYSRNMGQILMEKLLHADLLVFNRCTPALAKQLREKNLRMVNRRADIFLEYEDGRSEDYNDGSVCPFDLNQTVIDIPDEDFGLFYVDVMDHPANWDGRQVRMKMVMYHSEKWQGVNCPGRFAMVCCAEDISFLGLVAKGELLDSFENRQWIKVRATVKQEEHPAYEGVGPVLYVSSAVPCERPEEEVLSF